MRFMSRENPLFTDTVLGTLKGLRNYTPLFEVLVFECWGTNDAPEDYEVAETKLSRMSAMVVEGGDYVMSYDYRGRHYEARVGVLGQRLLRPAA